MPDVSRRFAALFDAAAVLKPSSPLRDEAAKIMAASADPVERAQLALRLVEQQIRYVYVGLDGGGYRPTTADDTWQRRFGDCKAKTVLLLAMLREMKIAAEPVVVNSQGGDGSDARLPNPGLFDHVLIRATIGDKRFWLDGTRLGDLYLDLLPSPPFRWALPLRAGGAALEPIAPVPLALPQLIQAIAIDASAGFAKPAKVTAENVLRQDEAFAISSQLAAQSPEDANRAVRAYWREQMNWVEPDEVGWRYDERRATIVLTLSGQGKLDWNGDDAEGRSFTIPGAGFYPPDLRHRPKEQDQTAPWAMEFPRYKCYATTIRLPPAGAGRHWTYFANPVDRRLGQTEYWRAATLRDGVMRTVMSSRVLRPELSAEEARQVNEAIPGFNNKTSSVFETVNKSDAVIATAKSGPFADTVDWAVDAAACHAPAAR